MVTGFRIQNKYWLDRISYSRSSSDFNSISNGKFPGDQSGDCQPGKEFENRIKKLIMIRNYLKQTWRSLVKNKIYSVLNIVGLSVGLTCFGLIALWVNDELSYDKFNANYNRIVRLTGIEKRDAGISESAVSSAPMAKALKQDPEHMRQVFFLSRFLLHVVVQQKLLIPKDQDRRSALLIQKIF